MPDRCEAQALKGSVEADMDTYHRERSMQEWEHFQGATEEAKVLSLSSPEAALIQLKAPHRAHCLCPVCQRV